MMNIEIKETEELARRFNLNSMPGHLPMWIAQLNSFHNTAAFKSWDACRMANAEYTEHPLFDVLLATIEQAMRGKGQRHGGAATPFLEQQWVALAKSHGIGFLTGQAAKKLNEAAAGKTGEDYEREVLGAIVYAGMALLKHRGAA